MRDLSRLFAARHIAVIGGGAWGAAILGAAQRVGFAGRVTFVHPQGKALEGCVSVRGLDEVDEPIDAAFVGVNRAATLEVVAELAARRCGGAVCFASGFSEAVGEDAGAADLQDQLAAAAGDMPILGPNCYGFVNALDGAAIWPDQHGMTPVDRGVAILTQSSNIAINLTMQQRGVPIAHMITCGNQAQTSQAKMAMALLDDERVSAIGLHIEGFGSTRDWHDLAMKASERGVPLVAIKAGRSDQAQRATVSHTASLAGSDAGAQALLDRLGIARVDDLPAFLETLKLLHICGRLSSSAISCISCSGGEASLAADSAEGLALHFPDLTEAQRTAMRAALGPMVALANPLDYHTYIWRDTAAMTAAWAPMAADHVGLTFAIVDYPTTDAADWACATEAALQVRARTGRPFAVVATLPELMPADVADRLIAGGVAPMFGLREALIAAEAASAAPVPQQVPPLRSGPRAETGVVIDEAASKSALALVGVPVPVSCVLAPGEALPAELDDAVLALKALGLAHKTEANAVRLGVIRATLDQTLVQLPGDRILVEEMITDAVAELLIGVTRDPAHGFVLTIGAGGVLTELWQDTMSCLVPTDRERLTQGLQTLRIWPLLAGYRGKPAADLEAVLDAIMAVQAYVVDHADDLDEVEINPLIATPDRAVAVDALIRKG